MIKYRLTIRIFNEFKMLKDKSSIGRHSFLARGYSVDTVDLDSDMIRKYVRYQDAKKARTE